MTRMFVYAALSECPRCGRRAGRKLDPALRSHELVSVIQRLRVRARCSACGERPSIEPLWSGPPHSVPTQESEVARLKSCEATFDYHCRTRGPLQGWAQERPANGVR
ncbi:MAG: hypothetical protein ACQRW7_13165 [Caulobacterales bacterium]|uniref:hypothetical protein n=1 Tax=Glycocaulis sp. TaxID=1969725 RepID=UPI003FA09ECB